MRYTCFAQINFNWIINTTTRPPCVRRRAGTSFNAVVCAIVREMRKSVHIEHDCIALQLHSFFLIAITFTGKIFIEKLIFFAKFSLKNLKLFFDIFWCGLYYSLILINFIGVYQVCGCEYKTAIFD